MKTQTSLVAFFAVSVMGLFAFQNCGGGKKSSVEQMATPSLEPLDEQPAAEEASEIRIQKVGSGSAAYCRYSEPTAARFAFGNAGVVVARSGGELPGVGVNYRVQLDAGCGFSVEHQVLQQQGYQLRFESDRGRLIERTLSSHVERKLEFRSSGSFRIAISANTRSTSEAWLPFCPLQIDGAVNQGVCGTAGIRLFVKPGVSPFSGDVPLDSPNAHYIDLMKQKGITLGYSDTIYGGADPVTRIQLAVFLSRLVSGGRIDRETIPTGSALQVGSSCVSRLREAPLLTTPPADPTTDQTLSSTDPLFKYIRCMDYLQVPIGFSKTEFRPNEPVTRKEAALALIVAFAGVDPTRQEQAFQGFPVKDPAPTFQDVPPTGPLAVYRNSILLMKKYGITVGVDGNNFGVDQPLNREAAAVFCIRTFMGVP